MDWLLHIILRVLRYVKLYERVKFGELDVVGEGEVVIDLGTYKHVLEVRFDDDASYALPPCGGGLPDVLGWELRKHRNRYSLVILWSVQRPRRIVWIVSWR